MDENSGFIVTQQGVPIEIAADYQKVIDSRWRFLDIELEQEFTISHADSGSTHWWVEKICDHNLGYVPAFTVRQKSLDLGGLNPIFYSGGIVATNKSIYWRNLYVSGDPTAAMKMSLFIRVFACDISTEYQAPVEFVIPGAAINEPDVGMKILANTGDINSTELSDFSVNTRGKAFAVQQTGTRVANTANSNTLTVIHNMGYPPTYFLSQLESLADFKTHSIFANPLTDPIIKPMLLPYQARVTANSTQLQLKGVQSILSGSYAFLITKEPTELAV